MKHQDMEFTFARCFGGSLGRSLAFVGSNSILDSTTSNSTLFEGSKETTTI
jgi:hypothetical protein